MTEAGKVIAGVLLADGWQRRQIKAKPKGQQMKTIRDSHVVNEGKPCEVVEFEVGDTIPADAIKIDGEWHVTKAEPVEVPEGKPKRKVKKAHVEEATEPKSDG